MTSTDEAVAASPVMKSCDTCPMKASGPQVVSEFGRSLGEGVDACIKFGTILSAPKLSDQDNKKLREKIGTGCKSHGTMDRSGSVFMPLIGVPDRRTSDQTFVVTSCKQCVNFVDVPTVREETGFSAGYCRAKAKLLPTHTLTEEATGCDQASYGDASDDSIPLLNYYTTEYYHVDVFKGYGAAIDHPLSYLTDKPVSEDDTSEGIISWRKIVNPENEKLFTFLPIFNPERFDAEERGKIPQPGDDEHPELYLDYSAAVYKASVCWREMDETPIVWGPAGVGKTELGRHLAYLMQMPFERFSITKSSELDDLAGKVLYSPERGTYNHLGRVSRAWAKPCVIVLDEPNAGPPEVWQFLRPLTDNSKQLVLDTLDGQRVTRDEHTYLLMAANPAWDSKNVGVETIGDADSSRLMHIRMGLPPDPLERRIIQARVQLDGTSIERIVLNRMMKIAVELRDMSNEGTLPITWGIRVQIKVARAMRWFTPAEAYRLATDDIDPDSQQLILDVVRAQFGA